MSYYANWYTRFILTQRVGADGTVYTELRDQAGGPRPVTVQLARCIDKSYVNIDHTRKDRICKWTASEWCYLWKYWKLTWLIFVSLFQNRTELPITAWLIVGEHICLDKLDTSPPPHFPHPVFGFTVSWTIVAILHTRNLLGA